MNHDHSQHQHDSAPGGFWGSRYAIGLIVIRAVAAYLLLSEHRAHSLVALPSLPLLACPLMHVFMHGGHEHHGHSGHERTDASATPQSAKTGDQP